MARPTPLARESARHWEISWSTLCPLTDDEVERCVAAVARLGCSTTDLVIENDDERYVAVRHREDDELLLEFGYAGASPRATDSRGLIEAGQIAWNWCCTRRRQPVTGLILHKLRQLQSITGDKLLVWDDDGMSHWSWGSCRLEETGIDPHDVLDAHLKDLPIPLSKAS